QLRQMTLPQQPRIIAMTANVMQDDRERCVAAGMEDFVSKPIRVLDLQAALIRCARGLAPQAAKAAAAASAPPAEADLLVLDPAPLAALRQVLSDPQTV